MAHTHGKYGKPPVRPGSYALAAELQALGAWGMWVWHTEDDDTVCDDCDDLDGESYDSHDDVPERIHPNCRCTLEHVIHAEHRSKWKKLHKNRHGNSRPKHLSKRARMWTNPKTGKKKR